MIFSNCFVADTAFSTFFTNKDFFFNSMGTIFKVWDFLTFCMNALFVAVITLDTFFGFFYNFLTYIAVFVVYHRTGQRGRGHGGGGKGCTEGRI